MHIEKEGAPLLLLIAGHLGVGVLLLAVIAGALA
jgi:hypothetical protein